MPDIVQATVRTSTKDLFRFMVFHAYSKISGMITLVFSLICLVMLPISLFSWKDPFTTAAFGIIVVMYLILTPLNMLSQSRRQVISNPVFKNPITYHISEEIFEVQQYTGTVRLYWGQLSKVRKTPFDYLFYVNSEQAFVLPRTAVDPDEVNILDGILEKIKDEVGGDKKTIDPSQVELKKPQNSSEIHKSTTKTSPKSKAKGKGKNKGKSKSDLLERQLMEMAAKDQVAIDEQEEIEEDTISVEEEIRTEE